VLLVSTSSKSSTTDEGKDVEIALLKETVAWLKGQQKDAVKLEQHAKHYEMLYREQLKKSTSKAVAKPKPPKKHIAKLVVIGRYFEGLVKDNESAI